ncbi:hypothetical protein K0M31_014204 [Melipona bicolor]|uniref:Uncharacterized protein n=1 Tax=Melipona bicolor TaxID=60889 RepID=A0AA40G835_9HYME|nr:hypothetical protein K0M31_014204 [Melipona bicolor]
MEACKSRVSLIDARECGDEEGIIDATLAYRTIEQLGFLVFSVKIHVSLRERDDFEEVEIEICSSQ